MSANYRLHQLDITNFMRVKTAHLDIKGRHVVISAKNGTGKTSTLDAIWIALTGPHSSEIPQPIHHGEKKAEILIELRSNRASEPRLEKITIERIFTPSGSKIVATAADGSEIKSVMDLLEGMLAKYSMNPVEFLEKRPQDQLDDYLMVAGVKHPFAEVKEITGEEFPLIHPKESCYSWLTRLSADETGVIYTRRRNAGRLLDESLAAVKKQEEYIESLPEIREEASVEHLLKISAELEDKENAHRRATRDYETAKVARQNGERDLERQQKEMINADAHITQLRAQLATALEQRDRLASKLVVVEEGQKQRVDEEKAALETLVNTPSQGVEIRRVKDRLLHANSQQETVIKRKSAEERLAELHKEVAKREKDHSALDSQLFQLRKLRKQILEGIDLGVQGLSVGEGKLLYNGVDFKQASLAQGLRVACAIVMRQKAGLKLLRIDNAEHLDDESTELVLNMADQYDWQVIMTRVDSSSNNLNVEFIESE